MALPKWEWAVRRALRIVRRWPEVRGIDYGRVYKDGKPLKTLGVRFHLGRKRPLLTLSPDEVLPTKMDGIRCDVLEASYSLGIGSQGNMRSTPTRSERG